MEVFNELIVWIQTEFTAQLLNFVVASSLALLTIFVAGALRAFGTTEVRRSYLANLELVRELLLAFVVTAGQLTEEQLSDYTEQAEEAGLENLDPRMVYVLLQVERAIRRRGIEDFDILELRHLAERIYQEWKND